MSSDLNLEQVLEELYARKPEHQMRPRLEPTRLAVELMGNPQQNYPIIHITGTNGKTSVARMIERILRELGLKTGRITSPHLVRFNERISLDGEPVSDERFVETYVQNKPLLELIDQRLAEDGEPPLTFFEAFTALSFQLFSDAPIDVLVLEVGIGGEWDATNVADADVAVFTSIDLDHTKTLGETVEEIAQTKAGIIKEKSLVVSNRQWETVEDILRSRSKQPPFFSGEQFGFGEQHPDGLGTRFSVKGLAGEYPSLWMPIIGEHQVENAATAIAAVELFMGTRPIADEILRSAMADAVSPGRLQIVSKEPLVVLDGAHNPAGIRSLKKAIDWHFELDKPLAMVAMLADKDISSAAKELAEAFAGFVVTEVEGPRALAAKEMAEAIKSAGGEVLAVEPDISKAYEVASRLAGEEGLFVTGSLYLIGAMLERFQMEDEDEE
jgi:dihydrofolate synthase/folylpolyglutamate synthase